MDAPAAFKQTQILRSRNRDIWTPGCIIMLESWTRSTIATIFQLFSTIWQRKMFGMEINQHSVFHRFQNKEFQEKILFPQKLKVTSIFEIVIVYFWLDNVKTDVKTNSMTYRSGAKIIFATKTQCLRRDNKMVGFAFFLTSVFPHFVSLSPKKKNAISCTTGNEVSFERKKSANFTRCSTRRIIRSFVRVC